MVQRFILFHAAGIASFSQKRYFFAQAEKNKTHERLIILRSWTIVNCITKKVNFFTKQK